MSTNTVANDRVREDGQETTNDAVPGPTEGEHSGDELLLGADSHREPTLSVVIPTLDEEEGIAECIDAVKACLEALQVFGEVVVSDDSTDRTPDIAREMGAVVVNPDGKGYGYAYKYAFERARGEYIAMGDADTTYDFEELPKLYRLVASGQADMAMGSRLDGEIKAGAMPRLHKYVGNPLLTRFLNAFYDAGVSDAHSGMRVFTREAYDRMNPETSGMEFASEMIMRASAAGLRIEERPITYHEREGEAKLESFRDGWRHVRFMLVNAPGYLFSGPGISLALTGMLLMLVSLSNVAVGGTTLGINSMIAGSLFAIVGVQVASFGAFATIAGEPIQGATDPVTEFLVDRVNLEHGATAGLAVFTVGAVYSTYVVVEWLASGYAAVPVAKTNVAAFTAVVAGVQLVFTSFLLSVLADG